MNILVTGGAGFIGSHTLIELCEAGHCPVVVDNLSNSSPRPSNGWRRSPARPSPSTTWTSVTGKAWRRSSPSTPSTAASTSPASRLWAKSVQKPWEYYENNIGGTLVLVDVMRKHGCKNIIFSSSATVYGAPETMPITEDCPKGTVTNPYGQTKSMLEQVLTDIQKADPEWNVVLLRYFNPIGAHKSGTIGEDPNGIPNNLMPYITQVAVGKLPQLGVFGNDYPTHDGTGVRDYIHVVDLAKGHVCALKAIENKCGLGIYNLGTGQGYSVLDLVHAFEKATGVKVPYVIKPRRSGDVAECWSDPSKAARELGLEGPVRRRGYVRRRLALAEKQPQRIPRLSIAPADLCRTGTGPRARFFSGC